MSEEGVWLLGPQPDVLNIQRHQEYCGSWGELDRSLGCALAQMESKPPTHSAPGFAQLPDTLHHSLWKHR